MILLMLGTCIVIRLAGGRVQYVLSFALRLGARLPSLALHLAVR